MTLTETFHSALSSRACTLLVIDRLVHPEIKIEIEAVAWAGNS